MNIDFTSVLPEIFLAALGIVVLVLDFFLGKKNKSALGYLSIVGLLVLLPIICKSITPIPSFGGTVIADKFSAFFSIVFVIAAIFTVLISMDYLKKMNAHRGEYYPILLFATLGMMVMATANDLINFFVGLELMALSFYVLVAFRVDNNRSVEGALKYFVLGALSSGIMLYGISFAYGFAGTTNIMDIGRQAVAGQADSTFLILAIILIVVGFSFKLALFPFHMWSPDTYEGAPVPVAALLSVGSKAAAFAVLLRILIVAFPAFHPEWSSILWVLSALTMVFGSVVALAQKKIVRMLAYSSIAHAGIIIMGLLAFNETGISGILYYLLAYAFMNMGIFTLVALFVRSDKRGENISDYKGLAREHPILAALMTLFLLSLAGVPPTGGFVAKFFILASAIEAQYYSLAIIGIIATAIALFFYAKVIFYIYMKEADEGASMPGPCFSYKVVLFFTAAGTVILGIYPAPFVEMAVSAIKPFLT
ncbi:MAG: NADH-quinone oxidoreductase subunit N [Thermodesulfobacteriota bacterium]